MVIRSCRGLFSNEAGMGTTPNAHVTVRVKHLGTLGFCVCSVIDPICIKKLFQSILLLCFYPGQCDSQG
ncbi:alanine:cation symporter family protein [Acetomicrobium mobile]|uniref:alanine:cation symporter family protein n=1 Tax=Acetomicrobium mobile TaxID=97477 RepID=UPI0026F25F97|nr:alanine:cation symporter family protein [Acetomicrobium mobile]